MVKWNASKILRGGGGRPIFYELFMALYFLRTNNWGSYEKIIWFYFLYEILKEFIFFKKIS